jgi:hypothetical protein
VFAKQDKVINRNLVPKFGMLDGPYTSLAMIEYFVPVVIFYLPR